MYVCGNRNSKIIIPCIINNINHALAPGPSSCRCCQEQGQLRLLQQSKQVPQVQSILSQLRIVPDSPAIAAMGRCFSRALMKVQSQSSTYLYDQSEDLLSNMNPD